MQMSSTERIEFLIDRGTWDPMDEDMTARDVLKYSDEDSYTNRTLWLFTFLSTSTQHVKLLRCLRILNLTLRINTLSLL